MSKGWSVFNIQCLFILFSFNEFGRRLNQFIKVRDKAFILFGNEFLNNLGDGFLVAICVLNKLCVFHFFDGDNSSLNKTFFKVKKIKIELRSQVHWSNLVLRFNHSKVMLSNLNNWFDGSFNCNCGFLNWLVDLFSDCFNFSEQFIFFWVEFFMQLNTLLRWIVSFLGSTNLLIQFLFLLLKDCSQKLLEFRVFNDLLGV